MDAPRQIGGGPQSQSGRYELHGRIGQGGMATVHLGQRLGAHGFAKRVAIKRVHPAFATDPQFVAMLIDEARVSAQVRHPNVVPTLDLLTEGEEVFLVLEYVHGESLSALLRASIGRNEPIPLEIALAIMSHVLAGLAAAHCAVDERGRSLGLVHRDVSPQNILVGVDGLARLMDFGVAKASGRLHSTRNVTVKGKLGYVAPEQLEGAPIDARADLFSAGVVLWELLVQDRLFEADSEGELVRRVLEGHVEPPSGRRPGLPAALDAMVLKALEPGPDRRFASALEMSQALEACGRQASPREIGAWVSALAGDALQGRQELLTQVERMKGASSGGVVPPPARHRSAPWLALVALSLVGALGLGTMIASGQHAASAEPPPQGAPSSAAAAAPPAAPEAQSVQSPTGAAASDTPGRAPARRAATERAKSARCTPPYFVTGDGHKHFKPECL
jgi:serine/threonine-protein kinase